MDAHATRVRGRTAGQAPPGAGTRYQTLFVFDLTSFRMPTNSVEAGSRAVPAAFALAILTAVLWVTLHAGESKPVDGRRHVGWAPKAGHNCSKSGLVALTAVETGGGPRPGQARRALRVWPPRQDGGWRPDDVQADG